MFAYVPALHRTNCKSVFKKNPGFDVFSFSLILYTTGRPTKKSPYMNTISKSLIFLHIKALVHELFRLTCGGEYEKGLFHVLIYMKGKLYELYNTRFYLFF
jgi:hypothetical protein